MLVYKAPLASGAVIATTASFSCTPWASHSRQGSPGRKARGALHQSRVRRGPRRGRLYTSVQFSRRLTRSRPSHTHRALSDSKRHTFPSLPLFHDPSFPRPQPTIVDVPNVRGDAGGHRGPGNLQTEAAAATHAVSTVSAVRGAGFAAGGGHGSRKAVLAEERRLEVSTPGPRRPVGESPKSLLL